MTVALCGVGLDSDNGSLTEWAVPPLLPDGSFDYIPIPETFETTEEETFGSWRLDNLSRNRGEETFANDILTSITPNKQIGTITENKLIEKHQLHRDPNFEDLTYGDIYDYDGKILADTQPDIVAFYTGLEVEEPNGQLRKQRFLFGYFTVNEIIDLRGMDIDEYRARLQQYPENSHAKRLLSAGKAKHEGIDEDGERNDQRAVIIADGKEPAELFDYPIQISRYVSQSDDEQGQGYYLTPEFMEDFKVSSNSGWVSIKRGQTLEINQEEFLARISDWRSAM